MSTADTAQQLADAGQLRRLRELRERSALHALREAERAVAEAEATVAASQQRMERLQAERALLARRIVTDWAAALGRLAEYASARQELLDDQLERTEYALIDDEDALADAREQAAQARAAWLRAVSQSGSADTLVADARRALRRERELREEREDPPAPRAAA